MDRSAILGYAAAGLGLLNFVWGFLHWLTVGNNGVSGYASLGQAVVGLSLAAGLVAAASVLEKKLLGTVPAALAVAAALVALGIVISHDAYNTDAGLILAFITSLVQAAVCVYAYLESSRGSGTGLSLGGGRSGSSGGSSQPSGGYGSPSYGGPSGSAGPGGFGGAQSYGSPSAGYGQQGGLSSRVATASRVATSSRLPPRPSSRRRTRTPARAPVHTPRRRARPRAAVAVTRRR